MTTILYCLLAALFIGVVSFLVERSEKIHLHLDRYHDAILAGLTSATAAFFVSLILMLITKL